MYLKYSCFDSNVRLISYPYLINQRSCQNSNEFFSTSKSIRKQIDGWLSKSSRFIIIFVIFGVRWQCSEERSRERSEKKVSVCERKRESERKSVTVVLCWTLYAHSSHIYYTNIAIYELIEASKSYDSVLKVYKKNFKFQK